MLGDKIKARRKELFLTLEETAAETGIDISILSRIENNKKEVDVAEMGKLCKALHINLKYFFES